MLMARDRVSHESLTVEVDDRFLLVEFSVEIVREPKWGEDADGNRGMPVEFVDDWGIDAIFDEETGENVTDKYRNNQAVISAIERSF